MRSLLFAIVTLSAAAGCQTQFIGDAHITPEACQAKCGEAHLVMAGMVFMGQYSSACLCEVAAPAAAPGGAPGPGGGAPAPGGVALASGALGAAAGVAMQMRAADAERNRQMLQPGTPPGPPPNMRPPGPRM